MHVQQTITLVELKENTKVAMNKVNKEPIAILDCDQPLAYLVSAKLFEAMSNTYIEYQAEQKAQHRRRSGNQDDFIDLSIDQL